MAYLGNAPTIGRFTKLDDISGSFNGSTTQFNLTSGAITITAGSATNCLISINGVIQEPIVAYSVNGSNIIFTEAPATGSTFFGVILGNTFDVGTVSDGAITNVKIGETLTVVKGGTGVTTITGIVKGMGTSALSTANDGTDYLSSTTGIKQGKHTIAVPAAAMIARTTSGAAGGTVESTTNKIMIKTLDFDQTTNEYAQFSIPMPKSWDEGTITAQFLWSSAVSGTNAVIWGLQAVAISDDDVLDAAFGTAQTVTDAQTAQGDLMITAETSAITIAGTPAAGDLVVFQIYRDAAAGGDTLAGDARLHAVRILYTVNAGDDT